MDSNLRTCSIPPDGGVWMFTEPNSVHIRMTLAGARLDSVIPMAPGHPTLNRLRSRTPVTVLTPLGALWMAGVAGSGLGDYTADAAGLTFSVCVVLIFGIAAATFVDRLWRMRAREASWWMFTSLTLFALLAGMAAVGMALDPRHHHYGKSAAMAALAPILGYLACRELVWLRGSRGPQDLEPIS